MHCNTPIQLATAVVRKAMLVTRHLHFHSFYLKFRCINLCYSVNHKFALTSRLSSFVMHANALFYVNNYRIESPNLLRATSKSRSKLIADLVHVEYYVMLCYGIPIMQNSTLNKCTYSIALAASLI